jgi:hypothetical protein
MTAITLPASDRIEIEELPTGWETARVTYRNKKGEEKTSIQIIDHRTDPPLQYRRDPMRLISLKCALLVLAIPLFTVLSGVGYCARAISLVVCTLGRLLYSLILARSWGDVKRIGFKLLSEPATLLCQAAGDTIRLVGLAFVMMVYCVYGILFPLHGRALAGQVERLIRGSDKSNSLLQSDHLMADLKDFLTNKDSKYCQYWAICFQPIAPAVVKGSVLKIEKLRPGTVIV